jgi:prolipoprotein diacylglyceryltransferase
MMLQFARCAEPAPTIGTRSAYTVLGFIGYALGNVLAMVLSWQWQLTLAERILVFLAPPTAFVVVVTMATAIVGRERIVFFQTALAGALAIVGGGYALGLPTSRIAQLLDIDVLAVGVFLVFGRIGCHAVACCHGRPTQRFAKFAVCYGAAHVRIGLAQHIAARRLLPVQLMESCVSLLLVVVALLARQRPGDAAVLYTLGYCVFRFAIEFWRGDHARPMRLGLSEAQGSAVAAAALVAAARCDAVTGTVAGGLLVAAALTIVTRHRRALTAPGHLAEVAARMAKRDATVTSCGVSISGHALPVPGNLFDWVMTRNAPALTATDVAAMATALWPESTIMPGQTPGVFHVIVAAP